MTMNYNSEDNMYSLKVSDDHFFDWLLSIEHPVILTIWAHITPHTLLLTTVTTCVHF